jgi:aquaporin Z
MDLRRYFMEFVGTFFFVFAIVMTGNPVAIAAMLMAMVYMGGHISGAHYNPAVTAAVLYKHGISWANAGFYVLAQLVGSFVALAAGHSITQKLFLPAPGNGIRFAHALSMEILLAFVLCSLILTVVLAPVLRGNQIYGFAIGFAIVALGYIGAPVSGGLFNPAIIVSAMGYAKLIGAAVAPEHLIIYAAGPLLGGVGATLAYNYFNNDR